MTPENTPKLDRRPGPAVRLAPAPTPKARGKKSGSPALTNIKMLIAGASLATTVGGWALLAQHDALAAQAVVEPTPIVAFAVPQIAATLTPTPTALSLALAAQPVATVTAAATVSLSPAVDATAAQSLATELQAAATDTPQATSTPEATSTPVPAQPTATAVTTTTTKTVITKTRSSR